LAVIIAVPMANDQNVYADAGEITVSGRIVTGFVVGSDELIGLSGVEIQINGASVAETDPDGCFSFVIPAGGTVALVPVRSGYSVLNPSALLIDTATDVADLEIAMVEAFGTIKGNVTHNGGPVGGILVYVHDRNSGDLVTRAFTGGNGAYSVDVRTGEYTVSISNTYYEAPSVDVHLGMEIVSGIDFELTVTEGTTYLFGLDLTHSMMLIGGIIGLILLIFAILYRINIAKHPGSSKVHHDRKKKDQE